MQKEQEQFIVTTEFTTNEKAAVEMWFKKVNEQTLFATRNEISGVRTVIEAKEKGLDLPLILTFCPAIENLEKPNPKGQTRKLVPLNITLPRAARAIDELFGFLISIKKDLKINPTVFLVFADSLEKGAENMFENSTNMESIAVESINGVRELFLLFDQKHPGLLQKFKIEIPKIRRQSILNIEAGKVGISRNQIIEIKETHMLDPLNPLFEIWEKHLILTRKDSSFVATGWQSKKGAEALWNRVRFLLSEFIADGELLPKLVKVMNPKKFPVDMPKPIFIASSTRQGGFEMEADGFSINGETCVISPFHNIGRWTEKPISSPWTDSLLDL